MWIVVIMMGLGLMSQTAANSVDLSNGYLKAVLEGSGIKELCLDPNGKARYGPIVIRDLAIGIGSRTGPAVSSGNRCEFHGRFFRPFEQGRSEANNPYLLVKGHTLGVVFENTSEQMTSAGLRMPTYNGKSAGAVLKLYKAARNGQLFTKGRLIAERHIENHTDNAWADISFSPQPPGTYFIEASDPVQEIGIWGDTTKKPESDSFTDGKPLGANLNWRMEGKVSSEGKLIYELSGSSLTVSFESAEDGSDFPGASFWTDWEKGGYDLAPSPFDAFYSSAGQWIYLNQIKRRPSLGNVIPADTITLKGCAGFDLSISFNRASKFDWFAEDNRLSWKGGAPSMRFTVSPPTKKLPDWVPVFDCPDKKLARLTTEFYLSHGANFGVGTYPDWKEWQGQILSWTASPLNAVVRAQLASGIKLTPEGYVYTWGDSEGWPFPAADADGDGKNDYDTRHFTTNPCFILGVWRLLSWTRDDSFAAEVLPRVRLAMDYQLDHLKGSDGMIVTNAKGHTGENDGIGSNYWDILPFGHKDAFSNIYYCASLDAMADIEEYALLNGIKADGTTRTPRAYRRLAEKARAVYREAFWDANVGRFIGCIDKNGVSHDYGFSFVNVEAAARGIPNPQQARSLYNWLDTGVTSSGKSDIYSRWIFAPRALSVHNPRRTEQQTPKPSWWFFGWLGTDYDGQCQDGGAILYVSFYDLMGRLKYLGPDNALARYRAILGRYAMPDRLSGGSPLFLGELTQGGSGGTAGAVGVEGEFPESGLVPCFVLHGLMGLRPDPVGLVIEPKLPSDIPWISCRNIVFKGTLYTIRVTGKEATIIRQKDGSQLIKPFRGGRAVFDPPRERWRGA